MTLDEAIKHCKEKAEEFRLEAEQLRDIGERMINEEAIKEIEKWIEGCPFEYTKTAFSLAIECLKKEVNKNDTH